MENERNLTNSNEASSLEKRDYSKEYWYLNQLKWLINFDLFTKPTTSERHFYATIARYIDMMQKSKPNEREGAVQTFLNQIKQYEWEDEYDKIMHIDRFLAELTINWYKENNYWDNAWLLERELRNIQYLYEKNENWKIDRILPWIIINAIPERYYWWLLETWLWDRIIGENRSALANTIREQKLKSEELKNRL